MPLIKYVCQYSYEGTWYVTASLCYQLYYPNVCRLNCVQTVLHGVAHTILLFASLVSILFQNTILLESHLLCSVLMVYRQSGIIVYAEQCLLGSRLLPSIRVAQKTIKLKFLS